MIVQGKDVEFFWLENNIMTEKTLASLFGTSLSLQTRRTLGAIFMDRYKCIPRPPPHGSCNLARKLANCRRGDYAVDVLSQGICLSHFTFLFLHSKHAVIFRPVLGFRAFLLTRGVTGSAATRLGKPPSLSRGTLVLSVGGTWYT